MSDRVEAVRQFLKTLEDPEETFRLMVDRLDEDVLHVIHEYAALMTKVKDKTPLDMQDLITCAIIIGFLMKSHLDRYDLDTYMEE